MNITSIIIGALLISLFNSHELSGQIRKDPRSTAMAGAYTTIARDFFSAGVNPANLAIVRSYVAMQLIQVNFGASNSSLDITEYNKFNGADLEVDNKKEELLSLIPDEGLTIFFDSSVQPILGNLSWNNMALSTDIYAIGDITIPKAPFEIIFNGNEIGREYPLEAGGEALAAAEIGFSNGGKLGGFLAGYTARIIRGINYFGIEQSTANFVTDSAQIVAAGEYFVKSSSGGWGMSFDIGLMKLDVGGFHIGAAINNVYGTIKWSNKNEQIRYFYNIDNLNLDRVAKKGYDQLVIGGNESKPIEKDFSTAMPRILRIGASTEISDLIIALDYRQGFSDRLYSSKKGRVAWGAEFFGIPFLPLRFGMSSGGRDEKEIGYGFGLRLPGLQLDFAYSLRGAFVPTNANGFELSLSLWTALGY